MARIRVSKLVDGKEMVFLDLDVTYLIGTILGKIPRQINEDEFSRMTSLSYPFTITTELASKEKEISLVTEEDDFEEPY